MDVRSIEKFYSFQSERLNSKPLLKPISNSRSMKPNAFQRVRVEQVLVEEVTVWGLDIQGVVVVVLPTPILTEHQPY